uniref:Uncharacterized protein n=1 Tax=Arundo donax TaxID=35708 RepID=A0A0A9FQA9_ARUDO
MIHENEHNSYQDSYLLPVRQVSFLCFRFLSRSLFFCSFLACTILSWPSSSIFILAKRFALNTLVISLVTSLSSQ